MAYKGLESKRVRALAEQSAQVHRLGMCEATTRSGTRTGSRVHDRLAERTGLVPWPKMAPRCHELGMREATTRSLESAIMAPSLNTASSTISSVGKYLCELNKVRICTHAKQILYRQYSWRPYSWTSPLPNNIAEAITLKGLGHDSEGST